MIFEKYYAIVTTGLAIWGLILTLVLIVNSFVKRVLINIDKLVKPLGREKLQTLLDQIRKNKIKLKKPGMIRNYLSRVADLIFVIWLLPVIMPVIAIVALLIKLDTPGPVFFMQKRIGLDGKIFAYVKFRTVYAIDAQADNLLLPSYDERITRTGHFLRNTNLDELPSVFNLVLGEVSIVGRSRILDYPEIETKLPTEIRTNLISIKPGIISLWSLSSNRDGNESTEESLLLCDLVYLSQMSFRLDFVIFLRALIISLGTAAAY